MPHSEIVDSYPLSPMQKAMFFQSQLSPDSDVYLLQLEGDFLEELDSATFWEAWQIVIERHTILRTSFHISREGEPYQVVHSHVDIPILERDLRGKSDLDQKFQIQEHLQRDWRTGFDLTSPPLLRLALFRLEDSRYYFVRTIHHLLSDSRSSFMQYQEVFAIYESLLNGEKPARAHGKKYREYIDWLSSHDLPGAEIFWRTLLQGFFAPTPLLPQRYLQHPEEGEKISEGYSFGSLTRRISSETSDRFRSFVGAHGFTLNTLLQAAWAVLLSRYSGEGEVIFGGTRNCRKSSFSGAEELVGPMVNTLPVRARINSEQTALSLLGDLRDQWVSMRPYEHCSLTSIAGWSEIPPGERLFESVVNYDHLSFNEALRAQSEMWANRTFRYRQNPGYSLALNGFGEREFLLQIFYDRLIFDDDAIDRMSGHIEVILQGMVAHPDKPLSTLRILTEGELNDVLYTWNDSQHDFWNEQLVQQLVEKNAEEFPNHTAVVFGEMRLSYTQLNQCSSQLSVFLSASGVTPDSLVGIFMNRSPDVVVAMLGILKAGGAYLPLDPDLPLERLKFMLSDARPVLILSEESLEARITGKEVPVFCVDRDRDTLFSSPESYLQPEVGPENLAYVIYTSGSTGLPKAVEITHAGLRNLVNWHIHEFSVSSEDKATQVANLSFDASVWEIWPYLSCGAQIHLLMDEVDLAPERLVDWYEQAGITISFLPTPLLESVLDLEWPENISLRLLLTGGDRLHQRPKQALPFRLINNYGPTECTVVSTSGEVFPATAVKRQESGLPPDIGRPISNMSVYVLDRYINPVPVGIPGELFVGGAGLGRGYLNRPELTGEKFFENPFKPGTGSKMYRTGDLVRYRQDGKLEYLGRLDTQVKVRGVRIELGEIEQMLQDHPAVNRAAVLQLEDKFGSEHLVAYLERSNSGSVDPSDLSHYLRTRLPSQMIPVHYFFLNKFPLTSNQKIDRQALSKLPLAELNYESGGSTKLAPRNTLENALAGIWEDVLDIPEVGVRDNFFDLGGNSLLAIRLVSYLTDIFEVEMPLKVLFKSPTIEELVKYLEFSGGGKFELERTAELYLQVVHISEFEAVRMLEEKIVEHQMWDRDSNLNE